MGDTTQYFAALAHQNVRSGFARARLATVAAVAMFVNNLMFFVVWMIYFSIFSSLVTRSSLPTSILSHLWMKT